jgi:fimbrial chaperone protein
MTRPVRTICTLALALAGGSFTFGSISAASAQDAAPPATPGIAAGAAQLNIAPLRIEIDSTNSAATLRLTNSSQRSLPVQTRLFAWRQEAGEDQFAPSSALSISPSIISIPPGQTQIVRLLRTTTATPGEKRFRLAVDQLPDPTLARSGEAEARLRFTIPVFLDRNQAAPARLTWRIGQDQIEVVNSGGATVRILTIEAKTATGQVIPVQRNSLRYVQGDSAIAWPISNGCALGPVTITAQIDGQTANVQASTTCA